MGRVLVGMLAGVLLLALLMGGLDDDNSLQAIEAERTQRTLAIEAERTQREAILQNGMTERTYISAQSLMWLATERESTLRLVVVAVILVAAATATIAIVVILMRDRRRPGTHDVSYLLSVSHRLPIGWTIIEHPQHGWIATDGAEYMLPRDVRAFLQQ